VRNPFLLLSLLAHAALLVLLNFYGRYESSLRVEADVTSSLHATTVASAADRLKDLQAIKGLMEDSADRIDTERESSRDHSASPQTMDEILERALELSQAIDTIDREVKEKELAELLGDPQPLRPAKLPPTLVPQSPDDESMVAEYISVREPEEPDSQVLVEDAMIAKEVAALEAKARTVLKARQQRLEALENGVHVEGEKSGSAELDADGNASALAKIGAFIGTQSRELTTQTAADAGENFFDGGKVEIPQVDASSLVLGSGRMFGPGGEYANRVHLNSWYIIGPFAGRQWNGLVSSPSYPPEKAVVLDAVYFGKDKRLLKWRYVTAHSYPLVPPDLAEDSVYYGYTEVFVNEACNLTAWIGADDDIKLYVNEQLVWKGGNVESKNPFFYTIFRTENTYLRDYNRTEGRRVLHFNKGRNKVFFKFSNGASGGFLSIVLTL
jgi:hypothetical protein